MATAGGSGGARGPGPAPRPRARSDDLAVGPHGPMGPADARRAPQRAVKNMIELYSTEARVDPTRTLAGSDDDRVRASSAPIPTFNNVV